MFSVRLVLRLRNWETQKEYRLTKLIQLPFIPTPGLGLLIDGVQLHIKKEISDSVYYDVKTHIFSAYIHYYTDKEKEATRKKDYLIKAGWLT